MFTITPQNAASARLLTRASMQTLEGAIQVVHSVKRFPTNDDIRFEIVDDVKNITYEETQNSWRVKV